MPILHILQKDDDDCTSIIINLALVKEIKCEYKTETNYSEEIGKIEKKVEMTISYAGVDQETRVEIEKEKPVIFSIYDNLGNEHLKTSNMVEAEKAIIEVMTTEFISEENEEQTK